MDRELELQLVARLRVGDATAFDAVYDSLNAQVFIFLARLAGSRELAEDLAEETWLRLVAHAPRLAADTHIDRWLFTVARNLHASYRRSRMLEDAHAPDLVGLWPSGTPGPSPFEQTEANEAEQRIAALLGSLPSVYREALLLVGVEGLKAAEAAEICGVTAETMRQRLSRARALLSRRLGDERGAGIAILREVLS